jgi:hypothetical protein
LIIKGVEFSLAQNDIRLNKLMMRVILVSYLNSKVFNERTLLRRHPMKNHNFSCHTTTWGKQLISLSVTVKLLYTVSAYSLSKV